MDNIALAALLLSVVNTIGVGVLYKIRKRKIVSIAGSRIVRKK